MKEYFFPLICHLLYRINTVHHNNFRHDLDHPVHLIHVTYINISFLLNYAILDKKKNNTTITGKKLNTLPTPANTPSMIRLCTTGLIP